MLHYYTNNIYLTEYLFVIKAQRQIILKYLQQFSKPMTVKDTKHSSSLMNSEIATFKLSSFDEFVTSHQADNSLASEAIMAFNQFLPALDKFFDLYKELTEHNVNSDDVIVKWYKAAVISSGDVIRAISNWYQQEVFDNISVNMSPEEIKDYITYDGTYFGKVITNYIIN